MSDLPSLNGTRVRRRESTIFIPLPRELWRSAGRCACPHCKGNEGFWDTLAVSTHKTDEFTWTVHAPEFHRAHRS